MPPADNPQPRPPKWVLDVNVWVSALISPHGAPARIVRAVLDGELIPVVSPLLLEELTLVLARPRLRRWFTEDQARDLVRQLAAKADMQPDTRPSHHTRDPDDDYLVALAELPDVVGIVTGDDDLLADARLQQLPGIRLWSPRDMANALADPFDIPSQRND